MRMESRMAKATSKRNATRKRPASQPAAGISDAAVLRATGKDWGQWVALLDQAGGRELTHREIAQLLHERFGVPGWWSQMVTVGYEKTQVRLVTHQRPDGFSASVSRTVAAPLAELFAAWNDARRRAKWLPERVTIRKATPHKSIRLVWSDGTTILPVGFFAKGADKAQVALEHGKLKSAAEVIRVKAFWSKALDRMKALLEA